MTSLIFLYEMDGLSGETRIITAERTSSKREPEHSF